VVEIKLSDGTFMRSESSEIYLFTPQLVVYLRTVV